MTASTGCPLGQDPAILDLLGDLIHAFDPTFRVSTVEALAVVQYIPGSRYYAPAPASIAIAFARFGRTDDALATARTIRDASTRAQALIGIAPCLSNSEERVGILSEALSAMGEVTNDAHFCRRLDEISRFLTESPPVEFHALWDKLLRILCQTTRQDLNRVLPELARILLGRGDLEAVDEIIQALEDVERRWP